MGVIKKSHKRGSAIGRFFVYLILIAIGISMIFPLYWMIRGAFMETSLDVMDVTQFFPNKFDFGNFVEAFESAPFDQYLKNTLFLLVFNVTATVVSCSFVAFGFSRINFRYRDKFFAIMLGCMMIPGTVMQIPQFVGWVNVGAFDTFMPLTIPSLFGSATYIFMLRQFFMTLPKEYDEAALLDGASYFRIYWNIILPLSKPALLTIGVFTFMGVWNDFFGPLIYLADEANWTLAIGLSNFQGQYSSEWHLLMAASCVLVLPLVVIYFFAQRHFIEGIALTGVKG
jgi:multiple sugar transport system permease protein